MFAKNKEFDKQKEKDYLNHLKDIIINGKELNFQDHSYKITIRKCFKLFKFLRESGKISPKMDSLLHNLADYRKSGWYSAVEEAGPLTMKDIHKKFH